MYRDEMQETFDLVLKDFTEAARENYGNDSFAAGYLRSLNVQLLGVIPKKYRQSFINSMVHAAQKQKSEVVQKQNQNRVFERT